MVGGLLTKYAHQLLGTLLSGLKGHPRARELAIWRLTGALGSRAMGMPLRKELTTSLGDRAPEFISRLQKGSAPATGMRGGFSGYF
jgi:hypothetical protein